MIIEQLLAEWSEILETFHLPRWEELPDFEIYMDQLITFVERYLEPITKADTPIVTASMINNYVKAKIMPKPEKKRYRKEHIAYVIAISILKEGVSISEIRDGIEIQSDRCGYRGAYNLFCDELESALALIYEALKTKKEPRLELNFTKENMAMKLCTFSLVSNLVARKMVALCMQHKYGNTEAK